MVAWSVIMLLATRLCWNEDCVPFFRNARLCLTTIVPARHCVATSKLICRGGLIGTSWVASVVVMNVGHFSGRGLLLYSKDDGGRARPARACVHIAASDTIRHRASFSIRVDDGSLCGVTTCSLRTPDGERTQVLTMIPLHYSEGTF